jgi:hypothetical protein
MKVELESKRQPATKYAKSSENVELYSLISQFGGSRLLNELGGSLALIGEPKRKAALSGQPKLLCLIQ